MFQVLRGDRIENSVYVLSMRVDTFCVATCMLGPLNDEVAKQFRSKIEDEYRVNLCVRLHPAPARPSHLAS